MMVWMPKFVDREVLSNLVKDSSFRQLAHKDNVRDRSLVLPSGFIPLLELRWHFVDIPELWELRFLYGEINKMEKDVFNKWCSKLDAEAINIVNSAASISLPLLYDLSQHCQWYLSESKYCVGFVNVVLSWLMMFGVLLNDRLEVFR